ncbi:hypothetical protein FA15DRAFT_711002 [Coprinopsis marcescibilis]|uniref:G domain-containing protein n=1 Tax=Coprinopsis marcescibilis TaxID=230819 RepID=A0A5C3KAZ1_COPMA|nr:hypothetical protein FA15DRAFT_711002 [Coprinopsis marcescibilis]
MYINLWYREPLDTFPHNIVLFGESGVGKSSIVNLCLGRDVAATSSAAQGCTFKSTSYDGTFDNLRVRLWDTIGLNEGDQGTVDTAKAAAELYSLLKSLVSGVSLLVFCMRAPRVTKAAAINYKLFNEVICRKQVPTIIVINGLENETGPGGMEGWWERNKTTFLKHGMMPDDAVGITSINTPHYFPAYQSSQGRVHKAISGIIRKIDKPWKLTPLEWFKTIAADSYKERCWGYARKEDVERISGSAGQELIARLNLPEDEANELASAFEHVDASLLKKKSKFPRFGIFRNRS